jgi:transposase
VVTLAEGFTKLIRQRQGEQLEEWLQQAEQSHMLLFGSFASGLRDDYDAVKAAMTLEVSNGQVEGQINRLKLMKRQMYGRASLKLLERRFILTS